MPKINLFIKIYVSFLLIILFTIGLMIFLDRLTGSGPLIDRLRHDINRSVSFYAQESLRIYQNDGLSSLKEFADRLEKSTDMNVFLFDQKENEIIGRKINEEIKAIAVKARKNSKMEFVFGDKSSMAARRIFDAKGNVYVFAAVFPNPKHEPPPGIPGFARPPLSVPPPMEGSAPPVIPEPPPAQPDFPGIPVHFLVRIFIHLLIAGFVCYLLAHYLTKPIAKLGNAAKQLADGNLSIRVSPSIQKSNDEIYRLAVDFDHMAERIEKLLTAQRNLLRDVSHELRSPLSRLNVALAIYRQRTNAETDPSLDRIEHESEILNGMIRQILTWSIVESGTIIAEKTQVDLAQLILDVISDADYEAKSRDRSVCSTIEPCVIKGNQELLRRAIENVIRNAVYYTDNNSPVEVTLKIMRDAEYCRARICVRDHGKGVPEDALLNLFKPFYRVGEGRDRESGGVGLGLAITDAAIRLHGGTVRAMNADGGGLMIEIFLPIATS